MANEILIKSENAVALSEKFDFEKIIKPIQKEIHLFNTYIAGTTHIKNKSVLNNVKIGSILTLKREPKNRFDEDAIVVLNSEGEKLGYVPEKDNYVFARLLDAGKRLSGKVTELDDGENFTNIEFSISMKDF